MAQTKAEQSHQTNAFTNEGERLEKELWANIKTLNISALEKKIAPEFQSIHLDGQRDKRKELDLIKNLHLGNYAISGLKTTYQGDALVVTYQISLEESIDNHSLTHKPSPRLSVWKKNREGKWQWLAHANLISLGKR